MGKRSTFPCALMLFWVFLLLAVNFCYAITAATEAFSENEVRPANGDLGNTGSEDHIEEEKFEALFRKPFFKKPLPPIPIIFKKPFIKFPPKIPLFKKQEHLPVPLTKKSSPKPSIPIPIVKKPELLLIPFFKKPFPIVKKPEPLPIPEFKKPIPKSIPIVKKPIPEFEKPQPKPFPIPKKPFLPPLVPTVDTESLKPKKPLFKKPIPKFKKPLPPTLPIHKPIPPP